MSVRAAAVERHAALPLALVVDRDADTRRMYAEFLHETVCEVEEAEDGREALAKALARRHDIVITETRLPGISGLDLCRLLRGDAATEEIAIVFVTGDAFDADVKRARTAGADAVLVKPCLPEQLADEIRRVLSQSHELRARSRAVQEQFASQVARSNELFADSRAKVRRVTSTRKLRRRETTDPPTPAPALVCPACAEPLRYVRSHIGGVSERQSEQWDYFECGRGCGTFQFRQRTRRIRRVD